MLELIGSIVLIYYLIFGVAVLIFLAWSHLDDRRQAKRRRREAGTRDDTPSQSGDEPKREPTRQADQTDRPPDNVVRFKRDK